MIIAEMLLVMGAQGGLASAPPPPSGPIVTRDGIGLHYESRGTGADTVIVPYAAALAGILAPLGKQRTMIFYDMRGRGRSDPITETSRLGFDRDVQDLEDVRAHFGVSRVSLIGFSYLAAVVAVYASTNPDRVARLVLLGGIGPPVTQAPVGPDLSRLDSAQVAKLRRGFAAADRTDPVGFCHDYWKTYLPLYVGGGRPTRRARHALVSTCHLPNERPTSFLRVLAPVMASLMAHDLAAVGRGIRAPTLVLHGDADHVAPLARARMWTTLIPDAQLELVTGAGHLLWAEARSEVIRSIDRFLGTRRKKINDHPATASRWAIGTGTGSRASGR